MQAEAKIIHKWIAYKSVTKNNNHSMNIIGKRLGHKNLHALVSTTVRAAFSTSESFMTGSNIGYIERMYEAWKADPSSVHVSWNAYFTNLSKGVTPAFVQPPTLGLTMPKGAAVTPALPWVPQLRTSRTT
jgi:hypothetical protein